MRLLVFCGTRAAIEKFDMQPDWKILTTNYPQEQRMETIKWFCNTSDAKLALQGKFMIMGWRAPDDTAILFHSSWRYGPDTPEWIQAAARVRELNTISSGLSFLKD